MKKGILILFLVLGVSALWAQDSTKQEKKLRSVWLHGRVCDSFTKAPVPKDARASLLRADSTIIQDTIKVMERTTYMSGTQRTVGVEYMLIIHEPGRYIIKVQHPNYETTYVPCEVKHLGSRAQDVEGPPVYMKKAQRTRHFEGGELDEVVVKATKVKMVWRGDTLVYNADAFNVPEGSMLDGLIKQLPGVELTEEGEIFVNGKKVDNLTLNGADFFKGKNKIMLENLPYYTVKNVEVYNKQTEEQKFLGNNDEDQKEYTMDVILKREYSIGGTANLEAGTSPGPSEGGEWRYRLKGFGLRYTDHTRAVLFGGANNVNESIDFNDEGKDKGKTNQAGDRHFRQAGGMFSVNAMEGRLQNITEARAEWKDDRAETRTNGETYLNSGSTFSQSAATIRTKPATFDLRNTLRLRTSKTMFYSLFNLDYWRQRSESDQWSLTAADPLLTDSTNAVSSRSWNKQGSLRGSMNNSLRLKLASGDIINLCLSGNFQRMLHPESESMSHYTYYNLGTTDYQHRRTESPGSNHSLNASFIYILQLAEHLSISPYYGIRQTRNHGDYLEYLSKSDSLPLLPDLDNTRHQTTRNFWHRTGLEISYYTFSKESGWMFNVHGQLPFGFDRQRLSYDSEPFTTRLTRHYTTFEPSFYLFLNRKTKGRRKDANITYNINQQQPTITSLVGFPNTTNPLYIRLGNPDLQMQTEHIFTAEYTAHVDSIDQNVRLRLEGNAKRNAFAQGYTYDSVTGVRTYRSENIRSGNWKLAALLSHSRALDARKFFHVENELRLSLEKSTDLASLSGTVSTELSRVLTTYARWKPRLRYQKGNLNGTLRAELSWQHLHRSLQFSAGLPTNIYDLSYGLYVQYRLPLNFTIDTDLDLHHRRGYTNAEMNDNRVYWNASLTKSLQKGRWVLRLRGYDLLGQVSNLRYRINAQGRTETWTNAMRRYALLTVSYRFSQKPKKK